MKWDHGNLASFCVRPRKDRALSVIERFLPVSENPFHILSISRAHSVLIPFLLQIEVLINIWCKFWGQSRKTTLSMFWWFWQMISPNFVIFSFSIIKNNIAKDRTDPRVELFCLRICRNDKKRSKKLNIYLDKKFSIQSVSQEAREWWDLGPFNTMKRSLSPVLEKLPATIRLGQGEGELVLHLMMVNLINSIDINDKIKIRNKVSWLAAKDEN